MRLSSTKVALLFLVIFAVLITRTSAHHDWEDDDCEEENNGFSQNNGYYGDQPSNSSPYGKDASNTIPYPVPTAYPPQVPGPAQSYSFPSPQSPSRTDLPGLHPPEQNSASGSNMFISFTLCSIIASITMTVMF